MSAADRVDLSITVVSHNHRAMVEAYLPSIFAVATRSTIEVLLIDNTGADGTAAWVRRHLPQVTVVQNEQPLSYAANINRGLRLQTRGRYFVALNPDVRCLPGLFDESVAFMDVSPDVGIMGPQLLNPDGSIQASCRGFSTPLVTLIRGLHLDRLMGQSRAVRDYLMSDFDRSSTADVDWVMGALMVVRREAIAEVGGMDERYTVAYSEDQDWCCRMWQAGWRVCYMPRARAVHDHQRSGMRRPWSKMGRMQTINAIRMFRKFGGRLSRTPLQ